MLLTKLCIVKAMVFPVIMCGWESWTIKKAERQKNDVNPWQIHVNVWQKPLQYCNVISLELIKINETKKKFDAFKLWYRIKLLKVPWKARLNKSILKKINTEYSLEGLMVKLKLQDPGHLMRRDDSLEKTLILGNIEGWRRRGRQRMRWLDGITDSMNLSKSLERVKDCCSPQGHKDSFVTERMKNKWVSRVEVYCLEEDVDMIELKDC